MVAPDGRCLAIVKNNSVHLRDLKGDKSVTAAAKPNRAQGSILFSPDSRRLLVFTTDRAWHVLDASTARLLAELQREHPISYPVFAADGRSVSVALSDNRLCVREAASNKDRLRIPLPKQSHLSANPLALSPDGCFLACSSYGEGSSVQVFSAATGKLLAHWRTKEGASQAVAFSPDSRLLASGGFDGTLLLWKVPESDGLPDRLSPEEAATFWQALAEDDAARANRALAGLAAAPTQAVPLIRQRFPTAWKTPDAKTLSRLIVELDDDSFAVRERATRELAEAGADAADALHAALANNLSPEARRRIKPLVDRLQKGSNPKRLRALRAIEVLERIGSPPAKELLHDLAGQPLSDELKEEVQASLRRLGAKP